MWVYRKEMKEITMPKYKPLEDYLKAIPANINDVTLDFGDIDKLLPSSLPRSASDYDWWWANESPTRHVQAEAWMAAGFIVGEFDRTKKWVQFLRVSITAQPRREVKK